MRLLKNFLQSKRITIKILSLSLLVILYPVNKNYSSIEEKEPMELPQLQIQNGQLLGSMELFSLNGFGPSLVLQYRGMDKGLLSNFGSLWD